MPGAFEIAPLQQGGTVASNGEATLQVQTAEGRIFRRRAIKRVGSGQAQAVEWAVAELGGVRCYFDGRNAILTRADLMP